MCAKQGRIAHKERDGLDIVNVIVRIKQQDRRLIGPRQSVDPEPSSSLLRIAKFSLLSLDLSQSAPRHLALALPPRASRRTGSSVDQDALVDLLEVLPFFQEVLFAQRSARQEFLVRTVEGRERREVEEERVRVYWVGAPSGTRQQSASGAERSGERSTVFGRYAHLEV